MVLGVLVILFKLEYLSASGTIHYRLETEHYS